MATILSVVTFGLIIALIVGLVKPALVLRWTDNPTRLKVFGYWILAIVVVGVVGVATESEEDRAKAKIKTAKNYIEQERYASAISSLESVDAENPLYAEAQQLLHKADSLVTANEEEKRLAEEAEAAKTAEDEKVKQKEQLERELKSVNEGVDFSTYKGSIDEMQLELALFATWGNIITEGEASDDPAIKKLAKQLKPKVAAMQVKEFPQLRKAYVKIVGRKMWENDIEVSSSGTGSKYITFTGGIFSLNKNKKDFQVELNEVLTLFRFKEARYKWYEGEDEYTYYTMYKGKDSELLVLSN